MLAVEEFGTSATLELEAGGVRLVAAREGAPGVPRGERLGVDWSAAHLHWFDAHGVRLERDSERDGGTGSTALGPR